MRINGYDQKNNKSNSDINIYNENKINYDYNGYDDNNSNKSNSSDNVNNDNKNIDAINSNDTIDNRFVMIMALEILMIIHIVNDNDNGNYVDNAKETSNSNYNMNLLKIRDDKIVSNYFIHL